MITTEQVYKDGHSGYVVQSDDGITTVSATKVNVPVAKEKELGDLSQNAVEALVPAPQEDIAPEQQ